HQWCRITDLKISSQLWVARRNCSGIDVVDVVKNNDFKDATRPYSCGFQTPIESGPVGRHAGRWRLWTENEPVKICEPRLRYASLRFQGKAVPAPATEANNTIERLQGRITAR